MSEKLAYNVKVEWDKRTGGQAYFNRNPVLKFDMATEFGGEGRYYCSDEVFLAAVSGCLLETYLYISRKLRLNLKDLYVTAKSLVQSSRDGYNIKELSFHFDITGVKGQEEKLKNCLELAIYYCHLTRALNPQIKIVYTDNINTV
ncbi:MAG: OsmC family protein [Candidatus Odinarchaeum yellowstonii]|uniref:OsmC family protein n=1 Tax=Odinarchaeota yellowstonii (strain LCB_4) TaxID=1841599 RepID=A0AAF0IB85_ODILC|nr:MAG: OsmC family protein [Candidatus Odinarchaeum yellowstonii]